MTRNKYLCSGKKEPHNFFGHFFGRAEDHQWGTPICPTQRLQKFRHFKAPKIPTLFWAMLLNVRQWKIHSFLRNLAFLDD